MGNAWSRQTATVSEAYFLEVLELNEENVNDVSERETLCCGVCLSVCSLTGSWEGWRRPTRPPAISLADIPPAGKKKHTHTWPSSHRGNSVADRAPKIPMIGRLGGSKRLTHGPVGGKKKMLKDYRWWMYSAQITHAIQLGSVSVLPPGHS